MVRLALTGDVMLGRNVCEFVEREAAEYVWGDSLPLLRAADLRFVNLECVIAGCGEPVQPKTFHFRAARRTMDVLQAAEVDLVSLANNHVLDYGQEALLEMLDLLDEAGIARVGAGRDVREAWRPARLEVDGVRVGVVAFTDNEPGWEAGEASPGVAYRAIAPDRPDFEQLLECVSDVAADVDLLVVSAHWGPNMRREPPAAFQRFARALLDAGARVFWGHSAHLFQGVERRAGGVILYDTGDFVDDYAVDPDERNDLSFLFELDVDPSTAIDDVRLTPTAVEPGACRVGLARGDDADWACWRMAELCAALGTPVERTPGGLRLPVTSRPARAVARR